MKEQYYKNASSAKSQAGGLYEWDNCLIFLGNLYIIPGPATQRIDPMGDSHPTIKCTVLLDVHFENNEFDQSSY